MRFSFKSMASIIAKMEAQHLTKYSLMKEASMNARKAGERGVSAKNVKKVTEVRFKCSRRQGK